jgi:hypothetical protein
MKDPELEKFEIWLKDHIENSLEEDAFFTQQVLAKIENTPSHSVIDSENWTIVSWLLCMVALGTLLMQSLNQIQPETLTGPVLESLALLVVLALASWQCQAHWNSEFE